MQLTFRSIDEAVPGDKWRSLWTQLSPAYQTWFLRDGTQARPSYLASTRALKQHLPELIPTYEKLVDLAGGGDLAARLLSLWCPTPYLAGCSQVAVTGHSVEPFLIRNYDYAANLCEGVVLKSAWNQRRVIAMNDCLWGALDGMNENGLAVSLAFGGRPVTGEGFGIPLVLRYILEFCADANEAAKVLERIPVNMTYNVTLLDASGKFFTAYVAPDRKTVLRHWPCATNHQGTVDWPEYAAITGTVEREQFLVARLADPSETSESISEHFGKPPLFWPNYKLGWGTLYTSIYRLKKREAEFRWRGHKWIRAFAQFPEESLTITY